MNYWRRHNRADIVRDLAWTIGLEIIELPPDIQEKLTALEKDYFKNHSVAITSYMGKVGIELNVVSPLSYYPQVIWIFSHFLGLYYYYYYYCKSNRLFFLNFAIFSKDMVPPKDPYIKIRVVGDIEQGIVMSDKTTNFTRHSMHFLRRTDAEPYIARVCLFFLS